MYRKVINAKSANDLLIELPDEYLNKQIEVIAFEVANENPETTNTKDFSDAETFFNKFQIDMSNFKFNRDEANER